MEEKKEKHSFDTIEETLNPKMNVDASNPEAKTAFNSGPYKPLPVSGYKPQDAASVALVNAHKEVEEQILRALDIYKDNPEVDQRWLAIGRTQLEQAFMAINRSIFKPDRVKFPEDK